MVVQLSPIEARECAISRVFSDDYAFEIPPYQRPYAWEKEHVEALLTDLKDAMDRPESANDIYFLGSIVLIKSPNEPNSKVVDGQQRLTTLTILMAILRDLTTDPERRFSRGEYIAQRADPDRGISERYRLLLREQDRVFFRKHVQEPQATRNLPDPKHLDGSQQRIAENAEFLRSALTEMTEDKRNKIIAYIIQKCYLVTVTVPTPESARRIFTVLNARGLDLTAADILKADLLERAGVARERDLANRWENIEETLGRDAFLDLFGHIRMIFEREKPRSALEFGFPKAVPPFRDEPEIFVSTILEPIADAALLLGNSTAIQSQFGSNAARAVRSLQRVDNKDWMPPALLRLWRRTPGDSDVVGAFLTGLERLTYYLFVTRADVNTRMARFAGVMEEFEPRAGKAVTTGGLTLSTAEKDEFLTELDGPLYQKSRVCKPVLQRLDEALSGGGASYDDLVSIEHVLPQTVEENSEWASLFPDIEKREEWLHRIANLVFLTRRINTRASNWDFSRKKREYFTSKDGASPFVLTQGVLQTEEWTIEHLIDRQDKLRRCLRELWQLSALSTAPARTVE